MGSKFLGTDSNNLEVLQDGSFVLNVASADIQSLVPNMPVRSSATRELVSGLIGVSDCNFTPLTNPVAGDLNMNNNSVTNAQQIGLPQNSSPSTPSAGSLNVYNDGGNLKIINSSSTIQTVATTANLAAYLPLAGGTMTGSINLGGQEISNCMAIRTSGSNIVYGNTASAAGANSVVIGDSAQSGFGGGSSNTAIGQGARANYLNSVAIGSGAVANSESVVIGSGSSGSSSYNVIIGRGAIGTASKAVIIGRQASGADNSIAIGNLCSSGTNFGITIGAFSNCGAGDSVIIGHDSYSNVNNANIIGSNLTNGTGNSLLVAASANIRANTTTCDLGTTAEPFQNLLLNGYARTSSVSKSIPCVRCTYSNSAVGFGSTTTETSVIDGTLSGSLTIPATTAAGFTMHMRAAWLYSSGVTTTFAIRFKVGGTTILTTTIPAGTVVNQNIWAEHIIQLRSPNNRLFVSCRISRDAGATIINSTIVDSIWNPASSNAITVTGQFSNTNGTWRGDSFSLDSSYAS